MNISKIKSILASVEFDILDKESIKTESLATALIEEKSISSSLNNESQSIYKISSRISSALTNGKQDVKNSIHYGYMAIGAIIGAKDPEYISDRISFLISKSILSNKEFFSSLSSVNKIDKVNESYYRIIPIIKQNELGQDRGQRSDIKISVFRKVGEALGAEGINTNFVEYAINDITKEMKLNNDFNSLVSSNPSMNIKK